MASSAAAFLSNAVSGIEAIIQFGIGDDYDSRAEVMYISTGQGPGLDGIQRLGLKFLDAPLPESFIPSDAQPLP